MKLDNLTFFPNLAKDFDTQEDYDKYFNNLEKSMKESKKELKLYKKEVLNFFPNDIKKNLEILSYDNKITITLNLNTKEVKSEIFEDSAPNIYVHSLQEDKLSIKTTRKFLKDIELFTDIISNNLKTISSKIPNFTTLYKEITKFNKVLNLREEANNSLKYKKELHIIENVLEPLENFNKIEVAEDLICFFQQHNINEDNIDIMFFESFTYYVEESNLLFQINKYSLEIKDEKIKFYINEREIKTDYFIEYINKRVFFFENKMITINNHDIIKNNVTNYKIEFNSIKSDLLQFSKNIKPFYINKNIKGF